MRAPQQPRPAAAAVVLALCGGGTAAPARYFPEDAAEVDREERLDRETVIDRFGYMAPWSWREAWRSSWNRYHLSVESMNAERFGYVESADLVANPLGSASLGFTYRRRDDVLSQGSRREIRIEKRVIPSTYLGVVADGSTYKKWVDGGLSLAYRTAPERRLRMGVSAVDLYYETKKTDSSRTYETKPWSVDLSGTWELTSQTDLGVSAVYDSPLTWHLNETGRRYDRFFTEIRTNLETALTPHTDFRAATSYHHKGEARVTPGEPVSFKRLERYDTRAEAHLRYRYGPRRDLRSGAMTLWRTADYEYRGDFKKEAPTASPSVRRHEVIAYGLQTRPFLDSEAHRLQWGLFTSRTDIRFFEPRGGVEKTALKPGLSAEVKLHTAWEWQVSPRGFFFFNANWNVDRLVEHYPYTKKEFRPWNGGNLRLMITL